MRDWKNNCFTALMGNCFKATTSDGFSLLRGSENNESNEAPAVNTIPRSSVPPSYEASVVDHSSAGDSSHSYIPNLSQPVTPLTEDEQIRIAKRIGLINHLPSGTYDGSKKARECVICMNEFVVGDLLRYLPCLHTYHRECIDDWMMRSFTCPSCLEPVDAALLMTYETN